MARHLPEAKDLQKKIDAIQSEIRTYSDVIQLADGDERIALEEHVRQLQTKLLMTEKTRKQALRRFYARVNTKE